METHRATTAVSASSRNRLVNVTGCQPEPFSRVNTRPEWTHDVVCVTAGHDADRLRKLARGLYLSGQRRWHFVNESAARRNKTVDALVEMAVYAADFVTGKGSEELVRAACLRTLAPRLADPGARRIFMESREGRDGVDRQLLHSLLAARDVTYQHLPPHGECGLWVPDAIAWSYGAGGRWREKISPLVANVEDIGSL